MTTKLRNVDFILCDMWKSLTVVEQEHEKHDIVLGRLNSVLVPDGFNRTDLETVY